ncbi:MAG TPA: hypothetical protein VFT79_02535 [Solirubrobacterales bacterium]|nr:hypothetical protein [Solirubrobacterales bacterium]
MGASAASAAGPLRGKLDRSFGIGGRAVFDLGPTFANSYFQAMARQPDGGIVLAGTTEVVKGKYNESTGFVQRRGPTGELDTGFGGGLVQVPAVGGLALQADGRVLVGAPEGSGCFSTSTARRLGPDGAPDPSFGEAGTSAKVPLSARYIAVDAEGRIVLAGIGAFGPCSRMGHAAFELTLARLLPNGALDRSFGQEGVVRATDRGMAFVEGVSGLVIREDGTILVAGYGGLRAFTPAGTPDPGFGTAGVVEVNSKQGALLGLPGGKVVVASSRTEPSGGAPGHFLVSRYLPNGSLDPGFGGDGTVDLAAGQVNTPTALAAGPEGSVLLGGEVASNDSCPSLECDAVPLLARFTATGDLDPGFGSSGQVRPSMPPRTRGYGQYVAALSLAPDGRILVAGSSGDDGNATVSSLQPNGAPDTGFGSNGRVAEVRALPSVTAARDIAIAPSGATLVSASSDAGAHRSRGILLAGAEPPVEATEEGELQVDRRGRFYSYTNAYFNLTPGYVTRFDEHGRRDLDYGTGGKAPLPRRFKVQSLVVRRNGQALVVGRIKGRFGMAAFMLSPDGRPLRRFGGDGVAIVGFGRKVKAMALSAAFDRRGRVVMFGNYDPYYTAVARLLPNGRLDRSFAYKGRQPYTPGLANEESAVAIAPDGGVLIAAAPEPGINPLPTTLIRLRPDGIRDRGFGRNGVVRVDARASMVGFFAGPRLILVSGADGFGDHGVALRAFKWNGTLDRRFGHRGLITARTSPSQAFRPVDAARQPDGKIVVAGTRGLIEESGSTVELLRFR